MSAPGPGLACRCVGRPARCPAAAVAHCGRTCIPPILTVPRAARQAGGAIRGCVEPVTGYW